MGKEKCQRNVLDSPHLTLESLTHICSTGNSTEAIQSQFNVDLFHPQDFSQFPDIAPLKLKLSLSKRNAVGSLSHISVKGRSSFGTDSLRDIEGSVQLRQQANRKRGWQLEGAWSKKTNMTGGVCAQEWKAWGSQQKQMSNHLF